MVNLNAINSIDEAKNSLYNDKELKDDEKSIFDTSYLKSSWFRIDIDKLKRIAWVLESVKEAESISSNNSDRIIELLHLLKTEREDKSIPYLSINNNNSQFDKAMNRLQKLLEVNEAIQGIEGESVHANENIEIDNVDMNIEADDRRFKLVQGITSSGNVYLEKDFKLSNSNISVNKRKTSNEIKREIATLNKQIESKEEIGKLLLTSGKYKESDKTNDEIAKLQNKVDKLTTELEKLEQIELQIQNQT